MEAVKVLEMQPRKLGHNGHEKRANALHAAQRAPGERGFALLKSYPATRTL